MTTGILKNNLICWVKSKQYTLEKGVLVNATWNDALKWWEVYIPTFYKRGTTEPQRMTTTDFPDIQKGRKKV